MVNALTFIISGLRGEKKTSLLILKVPYFEIKTKDLTFQNTLPLKMGAYAFVIRCLSIDLSMPVRFL